MHHHPIQPMREELTAVGFQELLTPEDVDAFLADQRGSAMLFINSVCGCATGQARPGARLALQHATTPDRLATVFAGQDPEATARAREYFPQIPPSSPSIALFRDGELVEFLPRHLIENRGAEEIAHDLVAAFDRCAASGSNGGDGPRPGA